jgi:hypothetical protein
MLSAKNVQGFTPQGHIGWAKLGIGSDLDDRVNQFPIKILVRYSGVAKHDIGFALVS